MTPELQSVVDRLEAVERQARGWKALVVLSILIAAVAIAVPFLLPAIAPHVATTSPTDRAKFSVVEANRFVLRNLEGNVAGGMEVAQDGTIRLVLGGSYAATGAAFMEVQPGGVAHVTLRGPDGTVRAALLGTRTPALTLAVEGARPGITLTTRDDGSGAIQVNDAYGRMRFRAP